MNSEIITVTNVSGTTWTVTRGAEGTTPVSHAAGFTVFQVVTAGVLGSFIQSPLTMLGDTLYENSTPAPARLAGNTSSTKKFLTQTGSGSVSAAPAWATIATGDIPAGSSGQVLYTNSSGTVGWGAAPVGWLNVATQYGADPAGNTDSTTAIQNAITACNAAGGGVVYFPAGTYKISGVLPVFNSITYRGDGRLVSVIHQTSTTANVFSWTGTNLEYVTFEGLQILGPGSGSGDGIHLVAGPAGVNPNVLGCHFRDLLISGMGHDGVYAELLIVSQFDNCIIASCGGDGFSLEGGVDTSVVFNACYADGITGSGYDLENLTYCTLNACAADSCGTGYFIFNPGGVTLNSCGCESSPIGFEISGGTCATLNSCFTFANTSTSFFVTRSAANVTLTGCYESTPNGATHSFQFDSGCDVNVIGWQFTTAPLQTAVANQLNDGSGNLQVAAASFLNGVAHHYGGTDTSVTATASSPAFSTGVAKQLSTTQDVILYIAVQTSAALAVAIGPANTTVNGICPSKSYALSLLTIRVPLGWWVKITGTIADLTINQVTC